MLPKVILILYFVLLSLLFLHPVNSGDFFHHINTGRDIVLYKSLPYQDSWSFTAAGLPWVAHSWGSGVIFYIVQRFLGYNGISVLFALLGTSTSFFLFLTLRKLKISLFTSLTIVFLASSIISLRWPTRPEVLGPFFISLLLLWRIRFSIPILFWLWGIFYGSSAFLGIGIFALYLTTTKQLAYKNILLLVISLSASLLNGYGFKSFFYIFQIPKIAENVGEWLPLTAALDPNNTGVALFYQYPALIYMVFVFLFIITVFFSVIKSKTIFTNNIFFALLTVSILAPFYTSRFINLAPLLSAPLLALATQNLSKRSKKIVLIFLIALALFSSFIRFKNFSFGVGLEPIPFQSSSIIFLKEHQINGNIFSSQELGAFIKWQLPASKIFIDTRDDLYLKTTVFNDLDRLKNDQTNIIALLDKYKAEIISGDVTSSYYKPLFYLSSWRLVFLADNYFVAVRPAIAEKYHLADFASIDPTRVPPAKSGQLEKAKKEMEVLLAQSPTDENKIRLAEILLALGQTKEGLEIIENINFSGFFGAQQALMELSNFELLARFYLAAKDCDKTRQALEKAESKRMHQLIFSPDFKLKSGLDLTWQTYYRICTNLTI